jgi:hypothetical protein
LAADASEHPVGYEIGVKAIDLPRADAGEFEEHGVDLRLAGRIGRAGSQGKSPEFKRAKND